MADSQARKLSDIVQYSQRDPRWKNELLGNSSLTIEKYGCLLTASAMVLTWHGYTVTPQQLNQILKKNGGFKEALLYFNLISKLYPVTTTFLPCKDTPAPMEQIDRWLDSGWPVIVELDFSTAPGFQNHWVTIYRHKGDIYWISDPWATNPSSELVTLQERFGFVGGPSKIITSVLLYKPLVPTPYIPPVSSEKPPASENHPAVPQSVPEGKKIRVITNGLRLRGAPSTNAPEFLKLVTGTELVSAGDPIPDGPIVWQPVLLYVAASLEEDHYIETVP